MRSIERTLLAWILGALSLGAVLVALATYLVTLEEMNETFDASLQKVAEGVASFRHAGHEPVDEAVDDSPPPRSDPPEDTDIVTLAWTVQGARIYTSDARVRLPFSSVEGLSRPTVDGEQWIVYTSVHDDGVAQAAQRVSSRQEMAGESATKAFSPLIVLAVIVGALLAFGLRRGLQPLDGAARDIAARSARSLEPITVDDVPREIAPLVAAINGLMSRLGDALSSQRRFLADAAHELRTPVTALRLQLQLLDRTHDESERRRAMAELEAGIDRSQHLIEQLLQVARTEPDGQAISREPVDLDALARSVVANLSAKADARRIDLGAKADQRVSVLGDVHQLTVLLDNLVENALRYTPAGGVVDVEARIEQGQAMLCVVDNGPGIPESERTRVFDRFYRGEDARILSADAGGSGLGLAIVWAIAERHDARVSLHTPDSGQGLEVRVAFGSASQ
jgi:signal transduction histidine kinase